MYEIRTNGISRRRANQSSFWVILGVILPNSVPVPELFVTELDGVFAFVEGDDNSAEGQ